ncbi:chaplin [Streptomyces sp. URMC 123]|uniref:chaplin n=1 Tax=Streptomyces sp. URMC 123 TaxID=3423403 RepID=UPI003F1A1360
MMKLKKAAAVTIAAGGIIAAGAGVASAHGASDANAHAVNSPGIGSGNVVQVPVDVPVQVCGNSINVVGLLNPSFGNECTNH